MHGKAYWSDRDEGTVHRAGIEIPAGQTAATRKDIETLMHGLNTPIGIAPDLAGGMLFTTESGTGAVWRAHLDGTGKEPVIPARNGATLTGICFVPATATPLASLPPVWLHRASAPGARANALGKRLPLGSDGRSADVVFAIPLLSR